ncbi:leukemia-associated protein 7 [Sardina pilchardus]|uniref:leukemia-associated protein 7 n=1 Tax=Sardina pilchardus TaxID=27697 RepID=UPI002E15A020
MHSRYRAWQMEALALLHQVRSRNNIQSKRILPSAHEDNVEMSLPVTRVCHGISTQTLAPRRGLTIAERARGSVLLRLMDTLSHIIAVEEDMYASHTLFIFPKDSIDLKNICLRMAEDDSGISPSDRDLRDLQGCLKSIAEKLLSLCNENEASSTFVILKLKQICDDFPEMW